MSSRQGGEGGKPKDDLLSRPYLIKKTTRGGGGGGQKSPILRRHSLWTAPKGKYVITTCQKSSKPNSKECVKSKKSPQKNRMKHQKVHEVQKVRR